MRRVVRSGPTTTGFPGGATRNPPAPPPRTVARVQSKLDAFLKPRAAPALPPVMVPFRSRPPCAYFEREAEDVDDDQQSSGGYSETSSDRRFAVSVPAVTVVFSWRGGAASTIVMATDTLETAAARAGLNMGDLYARKNRLSINDNSVRLDDPLEAFEPADGSALSRLDVTVRPARKRKPKLELY